MNLTIPFTKDIKFSSNVSEILSISLEHDYTLNEGELLGNFTITGDYKTHEVSVNKEHFEFVLPFSVSIASRIDTDSLDLEIDDFTYELIDNNTLRVNIMYQVNAIEVLDEERTDSVFIAEDDEGLENIIDEAINNVENIELPLEENKEERHELEEPPKLEKVCDDMGRNEKEKEDNLEEEIVMAKSFGADETFVTYQIHIMGENDTITSICAKYNTLESTLAEYNDLTALNIGDKIVIPDLNE